MDTAVNKCSFMVNPGRAEQIRYTTHDFHTILTNTKEVYLTALKEITHLRHFSKTLSIIFIILFFILFSETLIRYLFPILNHGFRKMTENVEASMSEQYSTGMAPANHIQAAVS